LKVFLIYFPLSILLTVFASARAAILCPNGQFQVKAHPRNAYSKQDGTQVRATNVKEQCRPYRKLTTPRPKFLANKPANWPILNKKFKAWTKEEETDLKRILDKLPKALTHIGEIKFHRSSEKSPNPALSNSENKIIVIYDSISTHDNSRVIAHELAHFLWDSMNIDERDEYYSSSLWKKNEDKKTISLIRKEVPIQDSYIGPHEDFSNNVELFLFQKESLSKNPQLIKYLEKIIR
jgi:hypothetical protein